MDVVIPVGNWSGDVHVANNASYWSGGVHTAIKNAMHRENPLTLNFDQLVQLRIHKNTQLYGIWV